MSGLIGVDSLGTVAFGDEFGGQLRTGPDAQENAWWPWVVAVLGAGLVVLGAVLFTPSDGVRQGTTPCAGSTCPSSSGDGPDVVL